jgi:hypothetical protein
MENIKPYDPGALKMWQRGLIDFPQDFIRYHRELAEAELARLKALHGFTVYRTYMAGSGWLDGMQQLHVVLETRQGKLMKIKWNDSHQEGHFFVRCESGGWARLFYDKDLG